MAAAFAPLQVTQFKPEDFTTDDGVAKINQFLNQVARTVNANIGTGGPVTLPNGIDAAGSNIVNVGGVGEEHAAISKAFAEKNYSAAAIAPKLEGGGSHALRSVRRIDDNSQREHYSTFLEGTLNTAPTTNTSTISGAGSSVTVSAGRHLLPSGNIKAYAARTDTFSLPASVSIVSLTRTSSVVTVVTSTASGFAPGSVLNVNGSSDSSFDGSFIIATAVGTTLTYRQVAPNSTAMGGTASEGSVFYYRISNTRTTLALLGPYDTDSQQNRLEVNKDGGVLIAVVVLTGSGVDLSQSAAGATPPAQTDGAHIVNRL